MDTVKSKSFNEGDRLLKELIANPFEGGKVTNSVKEHDTVF